MKKVAVELRKIIDNVVPMLRGLKDPEVPHRPAPKWSRQEILGHLIDSASNNQQKFVRAMQQPHLDFPGYEQDDWVALQNYSTADWDNMIELWESYNKHIAHLMETIDAKFLSHTITIEQAGPFTLEFIMPDYVEHLKHHLKQIFPDIDLENQFVDVYHDQ